MDIDWAIKTTASVNLKKSGNINFKWGQFSIWELSSSVQKKVWLCLTNVFAEIEEHSEYTGIDIILSIDYNFQIIEILWTWKKIDNIEFINWKYLDWISSIENKFMWGCYIAGYNIWKLNWSLVIEQIWESKNKYRNTLKIPLSSLGTV